MKQSKKVFSSTEDRFTIEGLEIFGRKWDNIEVTGWRAWLAFYVLVAFAVLICLLPLLGAFALGTLVG